MPLLYFFLVFSCVSALDDPTPVVDDPMHSLDTMPLEDPTPLSHDERYLRPWLGELTEYRDNPVARKYIALANLVDALPTWIEDLFIPLVIPHSTLTIDGPPLFPVEIPLEVPAGNLSIPLPSSLTIKSMTLTNLNKFKDLHPLKLLPRTKFSWGGHISWRRTTISVDTELVVNGTTVTATISLPLTNLDLHYEMIVAFNRTRLCDVWGQVMESSLSCALWPMFVDEASGVSGLNMTNFRVSVSNFGFHIKVHGLGLLNDILVSELAEVLNLAKPAIILMLPNVISAAIRSKFNTQLAVGVLAEMHRTSPCSIDALREARNVSQVCFLNNAGFALKWNFHSSASHQVSFQTSPYPADQYKCMNVRQMLPGIQPGQIIRVATEAVAGFHEIIDPAFRYQPDSDSGGFNCDGSTLAYKCGFESIVPVDRFKLPEVESVCVMNHAGFVMNFHAINALMPFRKKGTGNYPINQKKCVDLWGAGSEGSRFRVSIHAVGGRDNDGNRQVKYKKNGYSALYQCKGSTMNYHCDLLVQPRLIDDVADVVV